MDSRKRKTPTSRTKLKNVALFDSSTDEKALVPPVVPLKQIILPTSQPRRYFDPVKLKQLTQSIKEHGILEPLLVRPMTTTKSYELVAGERRYRAAKKAKLTEVPVVVKELTDKQALQLALVENLQREDLNPVEETEGVLQLLGLKLEVETTEVVSLLYQMQNATAGKITDNVISNSKTSQVNQVFTDLGNMNRESFTSNRLPLLNLPDDILKSLRAGKIEYTKAKAIARLSDEEARTKLLAEAISSSLSLSQIRELVKAEQVPKQQSELKTRFDNTYKQAKKAKRLWSDTKKQKRLEALLVKLEKLIAEEK